jgi:RimJ/RimL family protein N-acetyltransferase
VGLLTTLRPATGADAGMLAGWHADPELSRYWDDETFTPAEICDRLARERVDAWIIEADGEPVGYLQSWWEEGVPRRGGLDGFLVPAARGRRLMPDAARTLAQSLLDEGWAEVTVDPYEWNESAVRAWRKAGFVEVERRDGKVLMRSEACGSSSAEPPSSSGSGTGDWSSSSFRSSSRG